MLSSDELQALRDFCDGDLAAEASGVFDGLHTLEDSDKEQFWSWLKQHDALLTTRLKRAKQRLDANPPKPEPWYANQLKRAKGV